MARWIHALGMDGRTGCCGKTIAALGLGAVLTTEYNEVTCPAFDPPEWQIPVGAATEEQLAVGAVIHNHAPEAECPSLCPGYRPKWWLGESDLAPYYRAVEEDVRALVALAEVPAERLRLREGDQPLPVPNDAPDVQSALIAEIEARRNLGIQRYGTALQPFNGRDSLRDLLDELLDGATYALQVKIERDHLLARIAELEAERDRLRDELLSDAYRELADSTAAELEEGEGA